MTEHVCVTGASGYIAAHIVRRLLEKGYSVRGTVRGPADSSRYAFLRKLPGANERLELFEADLLDDDSFDRAVTGCRTVMHTASPYMINVRDPEKDLLEPAVRGTSNVLEATARAGGVERVVLTSSVAAVTDEPDPSVVLTEKNWNTKSSLRRNPYHHSKAEAERFAWIYMKEKTPGFDLVVINPFMVTGPSIGPSLNTTNAMLRDILNGVYPAIFDLDWGFVDVRDVAEAHIAAMEEKTAHGRYLCSGEPLHMRELVGLLRENGYGERYRLPRLDLGFAGGSMLVRILSLTQPRDTGTYLRTHVGRAIRYDTAKIRKDLGIRFRPVRQSILEAVRDLERHGHLGR
ncbi:epimerase [Prosthecochloris sp. GSB1]|uniref:SDR family oxidoreductase n=1 Tax=Prosthecochloris sp. GSB1 TaxID=281093 RepID=UPI000B8CBA99|nr:SDR family oxidoreductase [Prosthecochloris sp. GSB1]ASQ90035.1 epimerase [Prosthecochloris sp. GSB1]